MDDKNLPLTLPAVEKYLPTEDGEPPLARAENWKTDEGYILDTNTMPGWADLHGTSCATWMLIMMGIRL